MRIWQALCMIMAITFTTATARSDEGMWLFNALPTDYLEERYGFSPEAEWADHIMRSSVRFNSGGSASFVSGQGLVLTNHHVGAETLHKLSTAENNYYEEGFYAETFEDELKAPDLELNQLVSIEDVTEKVNEAVKPGMSSAEAFAARRGVMAEIEAASLEETGLRSDVVTLYGGGRYHLYRYKKYTDVRLVWSPEAAIAFFGGDADNFEYPRYCLDACLFRVYEDGKPLETEHFLRWNREGVDRGDLVFISGNPGRTSRILTVDALKFQRDVRLPYVLNLIRRREILLQQFGLEGEEQERRARDDLLGMQNARKAYTGMLQGLQNPAFIAAQEQAEEQLRAEVAANPELAESNSAWDTISEVQPRKAELLRQGASLSPQIFRIAQMLVRMAEEDQKPNEQRLREYRDSARESLEQQLFSPAPLYPDLEQTKLADMLALIVENRGGNDPLVQEVLKGRAPGARASEIIRGTELFEVDARRSLAEGGADAIASSDDPLIQLVRAMDAELRRVEEANDEIQEIERQAYAQIAEVLFATSGTSTYPDATFTLRLSFGTVSGYVEDGQRVPAWTTIGGAFRHERAHGREEPWELPSSWRSQREELELSTPFNFVCTADIIGGNSGSPVVDRDGQLVGLIFDGNIQSLTGDYFFSDEVARAISVDARAIYHALDVVYNAERIIEEIGP